MLNIRFYHIRTMLWTYLVWAVLNLFFAFLLCIPREQIFTHNNQTTYPLIFVPLTWATLHIAPLCPILTGYGGTDFIIFCTVPMVVAGLSIAAGLLVNRQWARFLVIIGMSLWFMLGFFIIGASV